MTIGSDRFLEFKAESHQESYHRLLVAQLMHQGTDSFSITQQQFAPNSYIAATNFEKCPGRAGHTGVNTRSGCQLTINFRNLHDVTAIHVILHYEQVVVASAAGVEVLD